MKTLANQTLIFDEDCPLCRAYSGAFVKVGMLDAQGKMPYSELTACEFVDRKRAANEIALVDHANKTTLYGIDSLLEVIGASFPIVKKIGQFAPVHFLLTRLYKFISYNRKVIMPNPKTAKNHVQCLPDFNVKYRVIYLIFAVLATAFTLHAFADLLPEIAHTNLATELVLAFGQVVFQAIFLARKDFKTILDYSGNLLTVSLFGSLLLLPMLIASQFFTVGEFVAVNYFGLTATLMFLEHFRRIELLKLPKILCLTWILYRILFVAYLTIR
ncbi:hypothetical protein [Flavobacterium sp.]|uniref:hypothetical protein n=1 Tax=Flavobacterium sp. TaxID=239 RepID=UPI0011F7133C|nr:hypothetical protein [Flavobacterium sp.]RZJ70055.1 MAG: hypothetical protein EOO49_15495 [Flavobacterium sp.]